MTTTPRDPELDRRIAALSPRQQELLMRRLREHRATAPDEPPIVRRPVTRAPLSYAQHRLWFVDQLDPGTPHYNVAIAVPVRGAVDTDVLQQAVDDLVRRHEALRTTFELDDETPVQVIHEQVAVPLAVRDIHREDDIQEAVGEFSRQPYDLAAGPLVRFLVLRLGEREHVLGIAMHHIVSDARSIEIMLRELGAAYEALRRGIVGALPEPNLQYADFALWQREKLRGEVLERQTQYWRLQLAGELPPLQLPADRARPAEPLFTGKQRLHELPAEVSARLHALTAEERTTPFALFFTAIATLLHRYTGQDDLVVGAPISNRARTELEGTVGYLGNTLGLRADLSGEPTFRDALRRNHKVVFDALANQDLPFDKVVELAQPERDLNRTPLVQVMFVYHTDETRADEAAGRELRIGAPLVIDNGTAKFDLTFSVRHRDGATLLALEYSTELFDPATIDRLVGHWETLLGAAAADPDTPIGRLPLLAEAERRTIIESWNATAAPFPEQFCLHELIEENAASSPGAVAAADGSRTLTYRELDERANRLARHLRTLGARSDVPVAVRLDKSVDVAVALLGILKSGSPYLPLDPAGPAARTEHMLAEAEVPVLLTRAGLPSRGVPETLTTVLIDEDWPVIEQQSAAKPDVAVTAGDLAYVIYTSGSTGTPKGVMVDHRGRVNNFHDFNTRFAIGAGDAVLALASLTFDMSAYDVLGTLMAGARIVFPAPGADRDPADWLERMRAERVTVWHSVPALLEMLVEYLEAEDATLPDLRLVLLGGDWVPPTLPARIRAAAPGARVVVMGGATEVSMDSTIHELCPDDETIPYGRPMANQRAYVLDSRLQPVPVGVVGELYLAGAGVGRGYLANPELTAQKFLESPLPEEPGRIYRTGDLARYRADGNLELLGRSDFQIKIRGWRIEPGEIEAVVREHAAVKDCLVVAQTAGNGTKRLVGYLLPRGPLDLADVRDWTEARLPDYLVPSAFVVLDRLPLTANGKVDLRNLPSPAAAQDAPPVEPRTGAERTLAEIWQELLDGVQIGIDDNFFALGGDSIKTIQTIARAKKRGLRLTPRQLFQHQTIRDLAAVAEIVEPQSAAAAAALLPAETLSRLRVEHEDFEDAYPLPPMQRVMYEQAAHEPPEGLYIIHADYFFTPGGLDTGLLVQAWQAVIDRYPVLRSSFHADGLDEPVQVVHRTASVVVERHDLRGMTTEEQLRRQDEIVSDDRRRGYDLSRAPLVRLLLLRLDDDACKYISSNHHIVLDGWSRAIVQQEVFAVYEALRRGERPALPPFRPFRDYISWVRAQDTAGARETWARYLAGFTEPTPLVAARGVPDPARTGPFAKQSIALDADAAARLDRFTRTHQITQNTVMQAAWSLLMCRYTGRRDVVLGVVSSGRTTELDEIDTVVGLCVNALPVRTVADPEEPLLPFLIRQQQEQVELRELDHTPLAEISDLLGFAGAPFETIMVYENYPWDGSLVALADRVSFDHPLCQPDYQLAQFEYPLRVEVAPGIPLLIMHYYTDSFAHAAISEMLADWAAAIDLMVRDPLQPLGSLL